MNRQRERSTLPSPPWSRKVCSSVTKLVSVRTYQVTEQGRRALAARRDDVARLELRTGAQLGPDDSLDAVLLGFVNRVRQLAPHLARTELEATLDRATEELLQLSKKGEARHT